MTPKWMKKKSNWIGLALFALMLFTIIRFGILAVQHPGFVPTDFTLLYNAADRLIAGEAIYRATDSSPFKYSPTFIWGYQHSFHQLPQVPSCYTETRR